MARILVLGSLADSLINFRGALLREMVTTGHEVFACAPHAPAAVKDTIARMSVVYRHVHIDRTGLDVTQDLSMLSALTTLIRSIRPDVFLSYTIKPVIYGSLAARVAGVNRIFSMITGLGYIFSGHNLRSKMLSIAAVAMYRLALHFNQKVFFQNPDDMDLFLRKGIVHHKDQAVLVNGSGVDIDFFHPVPYPSKISFLLIARLIRDKGIYEYAEAARRVKKRFPGIQFYLAGWLDSNPNCINERDLQKWQKSGVIKYLGRLTDVRPAIEDCAVYVLPSYREGTPRTVLEAMAMGRPVITTDAPGCKETVREGENGYMVPVRDAGCLADAMERFVERPGLIKQMGRVSREIAVEKYDVRKVNSVIIDTMGLS